MGPYQPLDLLRLAEIYSAATGLPLRKIGRQATKAHQLFIRLSRGEGCNLRTAQRVHAFFDENWPESVVWPPDIPRAKPMPIYPVERRRPHKPTELRP
jgi:hypothetical protein